MDSILNAVKDKVLHNDDNNNNSSSNRYEGGDSGYSGHGGRRQDPGEDYNRSGGSRDRPGYSQDEGFSRREEGEGYGGHGGRRQDPGESYGRAGEDSSRDYRGGYSQEEGMRRHDEGRYNEEGQGYSSQGGRSGAGRMEDDRYDSGSREYRPAQGSGGYPVHSGDYSGAQEYAERNHGGSGDSSLFSQALGMLSGKEKDLQHEDVHEEELVNSHRRVYEQDGGREENSKSIGSAAAMQALKMFSSGGGSSGSGGKQDSSAFIGMAMSECAKLFDQQNSKGNLSSGADKQDAVNTAAKMAMKLFMKSKMDSGSGGSGGMGSLLSMAGKFM